MSDELTRVERARLAALEDIIARSMQGFMETGRALAEVRDSRLYRETHATFEEWCRARHGIGRSYAYEVMQAAEVVELVSGVPDIPGPRNARVAAELVPLRDDPVLLREVWESVVATSDAEPTAEDVRRVRRIRTAPAAPPAPPPQSEPPGDPEHDTRFEVLEDVVEMVRELLPPPEQCVFPDSPGDVEALDEAVAFLANWTPRLVKRWRQHKSALRDRVAA